jgi:hypothetical protein
MIATRRNHPDALLHCAACAGRDQLPRHDEAPCTEVGDPTGWT